VVHILPRRQVVLMSFLRHISKEMRFKYWLGYQLNRQVFIIPAPGKCGSNLGEKISHPYEFSSVQIKEKL
jgi:hypothetical protein